MIGVETLRIAWGGIVANKLRSGLTILGMTIGVASVIILIAVGNGSSKAVEERIESLGTNVLLVESGAIRGGARFGGSSSSAVSLTKQDAAALQNHSEAPNVESASPVVNATGVTLVYNGTSYEPGTFVGTTPSYLAAHGYHLQEGTAFTEADVAHHARVAVIGQTVVEELFPGQDPVGQTMRANGVNFEVIGVLAAKGSNGVSNLDEIVAAPITTVQDSLAGYGSIDSITVEATSESTLSSAEAEVTQILEQRHTKRVAQPAEGRRAGVGGFPFLGQEEDTAEPGFEVINQGSLLETTSSTTSVFTTLLGEVAAISLLVGGIGVMNIMLVSVTERTREIGIRKAVGARRSDILTQFLTEAVLVSLIGGLTGVLLGVLGSQFEIAGVHPAIATYSIFLAFGAAVLTGLFFGTYPAGRAARLRPIEALRFE
jgi:putative ABC transport system permease protein